MADVISSPPKHHICEQCGTDFPHRRDNSTNRFCSVACFQQWNHGSNHPNYKGRIPAGRYVRVWLPDHPLAAADGYVLEHRLVLYEAGVEIPDGFHIHHINGIKDDNRIENLEVLSARDHLLRHNPVGAVIENQFGTWKVLTAEEKSAQHKERLKVWRANNKEHRKAYRQRRREAGIHWSKV